MNGKERKEKVNECRGAQTKQRRELERRRRRKLNVKDNRSKKMVEGKMERGNKYKIVELAQKEQEVE